MILLIFNQWPTQIAPYLVELFISLNRKHNKKLRFYMLGRGDVNFSGYNYLKSELQDILDNQSNYRVPFNIRSTKELFNAIAWCVVHLNKSFEFIKVARTDKLPIRKIIGQLICNYKLLDEDYALIYFNAIQTTKHFAIRAFFRDTKVLVSSRGQDFDFEPGTYRKVLKQIDHLHVLGTHLKQRAIEEGFNDINKITVIPPAILPLIYNDKEITSKPREGTVNIVTSARLFWSKGFIYGLRALAHLRFEMKVTNFRYIIMGDGPNKSEVLFEVSRLGLTDVVTLTGWLSQEQVNKQLSIADIYLLPSIEEGFNNSVLQAQQFGVPCVVSDAGGLPENVVNNVTGFVVPRYDTLALADRLRILIERPELRLEFGSNASRRVVNEFSLEKQVSVYDQMFSRVLSS